MYTAKTIDRIADLPFFFIIGRTRSGTTLLRNLFDAHPHVAIPTEIPFIPFTYPKFEMIKVWDDKVISDFVESISKFQKFLNLQIDKEDLKQILQQQRDVIAGFNYQEVIKTIACAYPSAFPKSKILLAGDKSPAYSMFPQKIYEIFPESKYVAIVRDYRDVVASVKKIDFELPFTAVICMKWRRAQRRILRLSEIHPTQVMLVRYEEFVTNPEQELRKICMFLGIEFLSEVLKNFNQPKAMVEEFKTAQFEKHFISLKDPINTGNIDKWKKSLKPFDIRIADFFVGKYAELSGYERMHKGFDMIALLYSIPAILVRVFIIIIFFFVNKMPVNIKGKYWAFGELIAGGYYRLFKQKKT